MVTAVPRPGPSQCSRTLDGTREPDLAAFPIQLRGVATEAVRPLTGRHALATIRTRRYTQGRKGKAVPIGEFNSGGLRGSMLKSLLKVGDHSDISPIGPDIRALRRVFVAFGAAHRRSRPTVVFIMGARSLGSTLKRKERGLWNNQTYAYC